MADELHVTVFADDRRVESLASYTDNVEELVAVFTDASVGDGALLDRRPAPDAWCVAEVLHHLADAELHQSVRLRCMLAEDRPTWTLWHEQDYAASLSYDARPAADALALILASRNLNARLLASLAPEQWTRTAVHPVEGEIDVARWVELASEHLKLHVLQARRAVIGMF
jgi:hypothetical protein